ncbi:MAG: neutral/alkaline non-lysosomal ceramidase N-terminal domain-containing protein [Planctomycetes bacterium]|nr:neutral/alkaline non-lysosomal ceramidase N-terminal domain-containing protein [Planctomycetota bacterium]
MRRVAFVIASVVICLLASGARADDSAEWKVGLAKVTITPAERMQLSGYAGRVEPFQSVEHDLFAKILVLEDSQGNRAALVTADLIAFYGALSDAICRGIREKAGLERHQILLNASHTHAGPAVTPERGVDDVNEAKIERYFAELTEKIAGAAAEAAAGMRPARLSYGRGVAKFVMNRREFTPQGVKLGVQPTGLVDRSVPVLRVEAPDGELLAIVFGAACHNTTLGGNNLSVCGDYAGFAQYSIEEQHPGVQAMFVLGCGGDANPYPRGTMEIAREHGEALGAEAIRIAKSNTKPLNGPLRTVYGRIDLPLRPILGRPDAEKLAAAKTSYERYIGEKLLTALDAGESLPTHYTAPLAVWQFGDHLTLVAISGETVVDYVKLTERVLGPLNLWVAGYSNDVFGYLPSAQVLAEGGYETRGLIRGGVGIFAPAAEDAVAEKIHELAKQAGR